MKKILLSILLSLLIFNNSYSNSDYIEKLKKLGEAYKSGLITKEIFESSKKRIIENIKVKPTKTKEPKKVLKKYKIKGKRSIALSWEDYDDLIAGSVNFEETDYKGTLNLSLPNNDGMCDGTYSLQDSGKGAWQIACTNNMGAAGTLKWIKNGGVTGIGKDYNNKIVKFTVSQK